MKAWNVWRWLLWRELQGILAHRWLGLGLAGAWMGGISVVGVVTAESLLWTAFQVLYYLLPLSAILSAVMIVRQDLGEAPLLAMLPRSNGLRVLAKITVVALYSGAGLSLFLLPLAFGGAELSSLFSLLCGGGLVAVVCASLGVMIGFRSRHEVRGYLGGIASWLVLLLGSSLVAYVATLSLAPGYTPSVTLVALMVNPVESFRIHAFFGLSTVPMNPHTSNSVALWWLGHPLLWLAMVSFAYVAPTLWAAGRKLRYRAHALEN